MEKWDCLSGPQWRFCYEDTLQPPGTDTFLLSDFPVLRPGWRVCDLGAGSGLLGLLLLRREPGLSVTGIELQEPAVNLAEKTAAVNGLEDRFRVLHGDLRQIRSLLPAGSFQLVVSNPPYHKAGSGAASPCASRRQSRMEETCTLEDVCRAAEWLLPWSGHFALAWPPERLTDLLCTLRACHLECKRLRPVQTRPDAPPSLLLAEGRRGGKPGLRMEPPLLIQPSPSPSPPVPARIRTGQDGQKGQNR